MGNKRKLTVLKETASKNVRPEQVHGEIIRKFRQKFNTERKWFDKFADWMTDVFGNIWFFVINILFFVFWLFWNNGLIPGLPVFDPFPFSLLTTAVSLEAIVLSIAVLISQNRQATIADMREEIDYNVNIRSEQEITKILNLVDKIHDHLGLKNEEDEELAEMKKNLDIDEWENLISEEYTKKK